jgi:hypothetical protein
MTSKTTLFFIGTLFVAAVASAQSSKLATPVNLLERTPIERGQLFKPDESSVTPAREIRFTEITLKRQADRVVQLHLTLGQQTAGLSPLPVSDVRGQAFITMRLRVETILRP